MHYFKIVSALKCILITFIVRNVHFIFIIFVQFSLLVITNSSCPIGTVHVQLSTKWECRRIEISTLLQRNLLFCPSAPSVSPHTAFNIATLSTLQGCQNIKYMWPLQYIYMQGPLPMITALRAISAKISIFQSVWQDSNHSTFLVPSFFSHKIRLKLFQTQRAI